MRVLASGIISIVSVIVLPSAGCGTPGDPGIPSVATPLPRQVRSGLTEMAAAASDHPRPATIAALESAAEGRGSWLRAALSSASGAVPRVGEKIIFEFLSDRDAYLTALHVDGEGNVTILIPNKFGVREIKAMTTLSFPASGTISVTLPIGSESVFAFATDEPLTPSELGISTFTQRGGVAFLDPEAGPALAACLQAQLPAPDASSAAVRLDYFSEASDSLPYTAKDVEVYFTTRTRSFNRPTLDLLIHFRSDSAELSPQARERLDEVGKALGASELPDYSFELNGHTDDVGEADYNFNLSERRSLAAQSYLVENYGVNPERLKALGHGETRPKLEGTSRVARDQNRRVELALTSRGTRSGAPAAAYRCGPSR